MILFEKEPQKPCKVFVHRDNSCHLRADSSTLWNIRFWRQRMMEKTSTTLQIHWYSLGYTNISLHATSRCRSCSSHFLHYNRCFFVTENPGESFSRKRYLPEKDRKHCTHRDTHRLVLFGVLIPNLQSHPTGKYAIAFHPLDFSGRLRAGKDYIIGILQKYSIPLVFGVPWSSGGFVHHGLKDFHAWQSDWLAQGVPGISVEQCAWRELFGVGALDSNQRHQKIIGKARTLNSMIEWTAWTDTKILKYIYIYI